MALDSVRLNKATLALKVIQTNDGPFAKVGALKDADQFRKKLDELGIVLPVDDKALSANESSPLATPCRIGNFSVGNRFCIQPMEGWDGTVDGKPSEYTIRRWQRMGESGAKLIWGGEAFAVMHEGRANPKQLYYREENIDSMRQLLNTLLEAHQKRFGRTDDLLIGLQLTHSGRWSKPNHNGKSEPKIVYHHPLLDKRSGISETDDSAVLTDNEIREIIKQYIKAAKMAYEVGFKFVDVKACHGYLGHEFLSAYDRPGPYGGSFENRTRFIREIVEGIENECPNLLIGVRLSAFDTLPHQGDPTRKQLGKIGQGVPTKWDSANPYSGFGLNRNNPLEIDLSETIEFIRFLQNDLKVDLVNISAGSPYYAPHIQRPAPEPPVGAYEPPEDPLIGCARQIYAVKELKSHFPDLPMVGTAYSMFMEYLPHVAQGVVREGWTDFVGIGRGFLSYHDMPADILEETPLKRNRICRGKSECTSAIRLTNDADGMPFAPSGCYPYDPLYRDSADFQRLRDAKALYLDGLTKPK